MTTHQHQHRVQPVSPYIHNITVLPSGGTLRRIVAIDQQGRRYTLTLLARTQGEAHDMVVRHLHGEPLWCSCCSISPRMTLRERQDAIAIAMAAHADMSRAPDLSTGPAPLDEPAPPPATLRAWLRSLVSAE